MPAPDAPRPDFDHGLPLEQIGPSRILSQLGQGGMGTVYLAEQHGEVSRRVALKLIKLGMDSKSVVARFEQERQALALMQHEGIAQVHDCGTTERGQPYFVMELVKGIPLTEFCERRRLPLAERLQLLRQVCAAVQHAHQKGVVHRDLKPSNVLVCDVDGQPRVKIIDFGLAKAIGGRLVDATLYTEPGQVVGTPEYMSPEQADPTNADIDTRADVYSIGVLLYELLVGELPFPAESLRRAGMLEVQRILREVDPPKPSTKLTTIGDASSDVASSRRTSLGALQRALRTDLDWVVLKAMEKDRNRRYQTANALAADLQRFLDHEPLYAGPPSARYRLGKLLRRYRGQVAAVAVVALTLLAGITATTVFAIEAGAERDNAARAERIAVRVRELLEKILTSAQPSEQPDPDLRVRDLLARAAEQIDAESRGEPELHATLLFTLARAFRGLGLDDEAASLARRALDLRRGSGIADHMETGWILMSLAERHADDGVSFERANEMLDEATAIFTRLDGSDSPDVVSVGGVRARIELAVAVGDDERMQVAVKFYRQIRKLDSDDAARRALEDLLLAIGEDWRAGRHAAARQRVRAEFDAFGLAKVPFMAGATVNYVMQFALWAQERGLPDVTEPTLLETIAIAEELLQPTDRTVSLCKLALSAFLVERGRVDEAADLLERCLAYYDEQFPEDPTEALDALTGLLVVRIGQQRHADVDTLLSRLPAPEMLDDKEIGYVRRIAEELHDAGRTERAIALAEHHLGPAERAGDQSTGHAFIRWTLGTWQAKAADYDAATRNLAATYDVFATDSTVADASRRQLVEHLVEFHTRAEQPAAAERWRERLK